MANEYVFRKQIRAQALSMYKALTALVNAHDEQPPMLTEKEWNAARRVLDRITEPPVKSVVQVGEYDNGHYPVSHKVVKA